MPLPNLTLAEVNKVMCEPRITVIINSYNYAAYLRQAIDSAVLQDYRNKEVVVVDDGSTDGSAAIIASYGRAITPLLHANMGQARTCLRAVSRATGDYILFLDSDDYLLPGALAAVAAVCTPAVAKVQFELQPVGPNGEAVGQPWPTTVSHSRQALLKLIEERGTYVTPPNSGNVHRADVFTYIDDIDYEASIDGVVNLLAPLLGEVIHLPRPLACYRYHTDNFSEHGRLNPGRFALEMRRHRDRLSHLKAIADENRLPGLRLSDSGRHSFVCTREILMKVSAGQRPGLALLIRHAHSLLREREAFDRTAKLWIWAAAVQLAPDRWRRKLAIYRSDPRSR